LPLEHVSNSSRDSRFAIEMPSTPRRRVFDPTMTEKQSIASTSDVETSDTRPMVARRPRNSGNNGR
jgi:hypothetical protein